MEHLRRISVEGLANLVTIGFREVGQTPEESVEFGLASFCPARPQLLDHRCRGAMVHVAHEAAGLLVDDRQCPGQFALPALAVRLARRSEVVAAVEPDARPLADPRIEVPRHREIEHHPGHRCSHGSERVADRTAVAQALDKRCAEEDEHEARHEGDPHRDHGTDRAGDEGRQIAWMAVRREEADEFHHHDERARSRLGEAKPDGHIASRDPAVSLYRLLGDIAQHRIRAAERDDRTLGEKQALLRVHMLRP